METTEVSGPGEIDYRQSYGGDPKELRKTLEAYVEYTFAGKLDKFTHTAPEDLSTLFRLRLEISNAKRGSSDLTGAAVGILTPPLWSDLPDFITEYGHRFGCR